MKQSPVLVVSIDGLAPRAITRESMPNLTGLALTGASLFSARTVFPSSTLPAEPIVAPSFLQAARSAGLRTAALYNGTLFTSLFEPTATAEDAETTHLTCDLLRRKTHDVTFTYCAALDLAGHEFGWDSPEYGAAIKVVDQQLGEMLVAAGADCSVIVTTDHGGLGRNHTKSRPIDMETFMVLRSDRVTAATAWSEASILDVAPTVADLCGFAPDAAWQGQSLIGREQAVSDVLVELLAASEAFSYGENVNTLDHALQAAALASAEQDTADLVLAALLHDIGHVLGDAGDWGLPDHAEVAARMLQSLLPPTVVEPIRLHVAAKRYLVATDPEYFGRLSEASVMTLAQQGGSFTVDEVAEFETNQHWQSAVALRRWDDNGKANGLVIAPLESYRQLIVDALRAG